MTRNQYNNVIQWTLSQCSDSSGDSLLASREIFRNLGIPFPNGDYTEVLRTMMSGVYMGWSICTIEQAAQCADQGIPAVGLSTSRVIVVMPEEAEEVVINKAEEEIVSETAGIALPAGEITVDERMDMQFFAFAEIENQNLAAVGGAVRIAGRSGGPGDVYYSAPRYVSTPGGVILRDTPNGDSVGFVDTGGKKVSVTLANKSVVIPVRTPVVYKDGYQWIRVRAYITHIEEVNGRNRLGEKYIGWIVLSYTRPIPTPVPNKNEVCSTLNADLKADQLAMLTNARYIHNDLRMQSSTYSWTNNAIYAILGNMVQESSINPNYWQGGHTNDMSVGYGLTQWTDASKYIDWITALHKAKEDIDNQLYRIKCEVRLNLDDQWIAGNYKPSMSFLRFIHSNESVEVLSECFLRCYEKPKYVDTKVLQRQRLAIMCQDWLSQF
ncbi:MAG: hypothetical protein HFI75_04795 [Lachnospiraceae bacterium]|nr:hypothetical protein [Lachnospiraceae bacterium]